MVTTPGCGLNGRYLAHDRRLLLALSGLLRVQRVVPLLCVHVVLNYLSCLPLGETQLVLVLDGTCHLLLLLLLEDNRRSRFAEIMLFGGRLGGTSLYVQRLHRGVQGLLILGMTRVLPLEVRLFLVLESLNLFPHGIRVKYLLINGIQLFAIGLLDLLGLPTRCGGRLELGVHDL